MYRLYMYLLKNFPVNFLLFSSKLAMQEFNSDDDDEDDFWGLEKTKTPKPYPMASPVKKGEIKLSFSIPSLVTSPVSSVVVESTPNQIDPQSHLYGSISPFGIKATSYSKELSADPISDVFVDYNDSSLYPDEDKSDLHDILDALLNFESTIEPLSADPAGDPYTDSHAPIDTYGNSARRQEVERENSRLAKQIKQTKSCLVRSSSSHGSIAKHTEARGINKTRLTAIEQENLNLLKRIQTAKTSKYISRREHDRHFESHKVYGKISSKQRQLNSSPATRSMYSLTKPDWVT